MNTKTIFGVMALGVALPVFAATQHVPLPKPKTEGEVTYLSGGIGHLEAQAMRRAAKNYPLSMIFSAGKRGEYIADVHVDIKDKLGKTVLDTISNGPIMLTKLPAGDYQVTAEYAGKTLRREAKLSGKGDVQEAFNWPQT